MGLLSTSVRVGQFALGATLVGRDIAGHAARGASEMVHAGVGSAAATVVGTLAEAIGGPASRRTSSRGQTRWIEVRGLAGPDHTRCAEQVLGALRSTPGVERVVLNPATARVVVTVAAEGPSAVTLARIVADAEGRLHGPRPEPLPGDDALLHSRLVATGISAGGWTVAAAGRVLRLRGLSRMVSAPIVLADRHPGIRRRISERLGQDNTDLAFSTLTSAVAVLTMSATGLLVQSGTRLTQSAEAIANRRSWQRLEPRLTDAAFRAQDCPSNGYFAPRHRTPTDASQRYAERAATLGAGAVAGLVLAGRPDTAGAAASVAAAKPGRTVLESFASTLGRGLTTEHDALVLTADALRTLHRIDTVFIDPAVLHTQKLTITRVRGVPESRRTAVWDAARAALAGDGLTPGWHSAESLLPGAGMGEALVSPVRDPMAAAVVAEARRAGVRVVSIDDDGLRSLGQGFDGLIGGNDGTEPDSAATINDLRARGATVAYLTDSGGPAGERSQGGPPAQQADVTIGVWRTHAVPPWEADVLFPDLNGVWRLLHALPAAREAAEKGVRLSVSGSVLGGLMLVPGVVGSGPGAVNVAALGGLWTGHRTAAKVFAEELPHPEPGHDWHALPVEEVTRLLPRLDAEPAEEAWLDAFAGVIPFTAGSRAAGNTARAVGDFVGALREDLSDPLTPVLATGAAASALLGSPLDAAMVAGVLLLNTSISAQQTLHAQRVLDRLLAAQEPLARRLLAAVDEDDFEDVSAAELRPGDLIEVRSAEVIPADARLLVTESVETDESSLTGESLPVAKSTAPSPGAPLAERSCMLYAGTTMVAGRAIAVVTAVGNGTQMSRASAMNARKSRKVGLQAQLHGVTAKTLPWSLAGGGIVGILSLVRGMRLRQAAASAAAIAVAAVPEGLPLVVTLAELAAARRLTGQSALIRNPRSIEAFARLDVVCFDKTGTLSENRLQVTRIEPLPGCDAAAVVATAAHTVPPSDGQHVDHATDDAVHASAVKLGLEQIDTDALLPFQSARPYAAALIGTELHIKGSPEALGQALDQVRPRLPLIDEMASAGLRVIAVARRTLTEEQAAAAAADPAVFEELCSHGLTPVGLLGIADTLRPSAKPLLDDLQARGIGVRLITGDHPLTARVVANQLGLAATADQVMTGPEWELLTAEDRAAAVRHHQVFARMAPEHKVEVVQALEAADLVTAMVGDGANDAAAIRAATVGVGVVSAGSDPARIAADVMLLDGKIDALTEALDEGEELWRRVQSAVSMMVGHNLGEVSFAMISTLLSGSSALNARQILLINMLTDALPAAALAVSPQTSSSLPDRDEAALWRAIWVRAISATGGATLAWLLGRLTGTQRRAATIALIGLVLNQMGQILGDSHGRLVVLTSVGTLAVMAVMISTPGVSQLFGCTPVGPLGWAQAATAAVASNGMAKLSPETVERIAEWVQRNVMGEAGEGTDLIAGH